MFRMRAPKRAPVYKTPLSWWSPFLIFLTAGTLACASDPSVRAADLVRCSRSGAAASHALAGQPATSSVFATVEDAVRDAFAVAGCPEGPGARGRLRFGTIRAVEGGFAWMQPVASDAPIASSGPVRVVLRLSPRDVAVYGIHPRSGRPELDRINETLTRSEQALARSGTGGGRPLYVLTPSRRVVRHSVAPAFEDALARRWVGGGFSPAASR